MQSTPTFHLHLQEMRFQVSEKRSVVGLRMTPEYEAWLDKYLLSAWHNWQNGKYGTDGTLLSLMTKSMAEGSAYLYSAVCHDSGCPTSMWSAGRMEWLALELILQARLLLQDPLRRENEDAWKTIEEKLGCHRESVHLSFAIAPHKMRLSGDELESSAAGAGERSDIWLLARPKGSDVAKALGSAYHTTNVFPGTASMSKGQRYPESRILWRPCMKLPGLMDAAACALAYELDLPRPASVSDSPDWAKWGRAAKWSEGVLSRTDDRGDVPGQDLHIDRDSSDAESDE